MRVRTLHGRSAEEIRAGLRALTADGFAPSLAIAFAATDHVKAGIGRVIGQTGVAVFGASTSGELLATGAEECVFDDSVVVSLLQLDRDAFQLRRISGAGRSSAEVGEEAGRWAATVFPRPALLVLGAGLRTDGEQILNGILAAAGERTPVFGGLAGDGARFQETYVFDGEGEAGEGALILALDRDRVEVRGMAASGWQPLGVEKVVTRSEGNVVHTIDDVPALELYRDYLGLTSVSVDSATTIAIGEAPLQIVRDGYSVLRSAMAADVESRSIVFAGSVPQGARVRFSTSPGPEIAEEALRAMRRLRDGGARADAVLLFSCAARRFALGPMAEDEVRPIQELWAAPLVGMFTYGEIGSIDQNRSDFHNVTCVAVTLHER